MSVAARAVPISKRDPAKRSFVLCPWTTVRGNSATAINLVQDRGDWLDLLGFNDATFAIDCTEVSNPGGGYVLLYLESSPTPDESAFKTVAGPIVCAPSATPILAKTASAGASPLARFVRWRVVPTGSASVFDVTFRIRVSANRSYYFAPTLLPGCALWLRSDLGASVSNTSVSSWADQSGNGNNATPGTAPTYNAPATIGNGWPRVTVASGQTMTGGLGAGVANHTLFAVLAYPAPQTNSGAFAGTNNTFTVNSGFAQFSEVTSGTIVGRAGLNTGSFTSATTTDVTSLGAVTIYSTAAQSATSVDLFINGNSKASVATALTLFSCPNYILFAIGAGATYPFVGDAYEFILFNSVLSTANRQLVHRYLGARYGITVP